MGEKRFFVALLTVSLAGTVLYWAGLEPYDKVLLLAASLLVLARFTYLYATDRRFTVDLLMGVVGLVTLRHGAVLEGLLVLALYGIAETLEEAAEYYARRKVEDLRSLIPTRATVVQGDRLTEMTLDQVKPGMVVLVRTGESVPLDGESLDEGQVDLSLVTGEPYPVRVSPGDYLPSGAVVVEGPVRVRVLRSSNESTAQRLVEAALEALEEKPRLARLIERYSPHITLAVLGAYAVAHTFIDPLRALSILLVGCPSAFIISSGYTTSLAIAYLARNGIAVLDPTVLEKLWRVDYIVLDKTGTLTTLRARPLTRTDENLLSLIAGAAKASRHPVSQAIARLAPQARLAEVREVVGVGLTGEVLIRQGPIMDCGKTVEALVDGARALFCIEEELVPEAETLARIAREIGAKVVLASGDIEENVRRAALKVGTEQFIARASPEDKARLVEELSRRGRVVFVGDGINDTIAMARAHVGVAVGDLDAPKSVADVVVPTGPRGVALLLRAARVHRKAIIASFASAIAVKGIALAGGLTGMPLPLVALLGDDGSTLAGVIVSTLVLAGSLARS